MMASHRSTGKAIPKSGETGGAKYRMIEARKNAQ
jgi:hypothetical protein